MRPRRGRPTPSHPRVVCSKTPPAGNPDKPPDERELPRLLKAPAGQKTRPKFGERFDKAYSFSFFGRRLSAKIVRARLTRDFTVPVGTPVLSAPSSYGS